MIKYSEIFNHELEKAHRGDNLGVPHKFNRLSNYVPSIQKSTYYLIGAESGVGKTSFADDLFIDTILEWYLENKNETNLKIDINVFSFEIKLKDKLAKLAAKKIYKDKKILLDINQIYEKGAVNRLDTETRNLIKQYIGYFDEIQDYLTIYDTPINPTGIKKIITEKAKANGTVDKIQDGIEKYTPNNENMLRIWMLDHVSKTKSENNGGIFLEGKSKIDKVSQDFVYARNLYGDTFVVIQQLNRSLGSAQRMAKLNTKVDPEDIKVQQDDFKDSGNTYEDSDIVFGLFSPYKYDLRNYLKYDMSSCNKRFRSLQVLKYRDGDSDLCLPCLYIGEIGLFRELDNTPNVNVYDYIKSINKFDNKKALQKQEEELKKQINIFK